MRKQIDSKRLIKRNKKLVEIFFVKYNRIMVDSLILNFLKIYMLHDLALFVTFMIT